MPGPATDTDNLHDVRPDKAHHVRLHPAPRATLEPSIEPSGTTTLAARSDPEEACLEAAGPGLCDEGRETIGETREVIDRWIEEGLELEADILPAIAERTGRPRARPIRSWDYFTEAIRAARRRRLAQAKRAMPCDEPVPKPINSDRVVERMAEWINSGKHVPPSAVSNTLRNQLLTRGLVTEATLRRLQIY